MLAAGASRFPLEATAITDRPAGLLCWPALLRGNARCSEVKLAAAVVLAFVVVFTAELRGQSDLQ